MGGWSECKHGHSNPCRLSLAIITLLGLLGSGCATAGLGRSHRLENEVGNAYRAYLEEAAAQQRDPALASAIRPAGKDVNAPLQEAELPEGSSPTRPPRDPRANPIPQGLRRGPGLNQTYTLVDDVPEYRIGSGDLLRIITFIGPDSSTVRARVRPDGSVFLARFQIGRFDVSGRSPAEVRDALIGRLREFAPEARAEVEVEEYRAWTATLLGEVRGEGSGEYPLQGRTTVMEFIFDHGGTTEDANLSAVRLIRDGTPVVLDVLAGMLQGHDQQNPVLDAGDVVFVPSRSVGAGRVFVLGEVQNPGVFAFTEGLTVMDAVALAGSFTEKANRKKTFFARYEGRERRVVEVDIDAILRRAEFERNLPLRQGDIVVVPRKTGFVDFFSKILTPIRTLVELAILVQLMR